MFTRIFYFLCVVPTVWFAYSCSSSNTPELSANANQLPELPYSTNRALTEKQREDREIDLEQAILEIYRKVGIKHFKPLQEIKPSGGDDFEIRISVAFDLRTPRILVLKNRNGQPSASYLPGIRNDAKGPRPAFIEVTPKSGWENLAKQLATSQIVELRDEFALGETEPVEDMGWIVIEIKEKERFRRYAYRDDCDTPIPDGKKLISIVEFLEKDLGINLINCNGTT